MQLPSNLISNIIVIAAIGGVVAINLIIGGLIIIAVVHDGATAVDVASAFQAVLQAAITALGMLLSGLLTGRIIITHMLEQQAITNGIGKP